MDKPCFPTMSRKSKLLFLLFVFLWSKEILFRRTCSPVRNPLPAVGSSGKSKLRGKRSIVHVRGVLGVRNKLISPQTHDSYRVPNTMHIIHWPTTEPLTVWHLHFICILESGWFRSHISFFDKLPCQKWGRFAFSLSRSDSGCVAREAAPSGDRKPFVTDDWVNRLVLINILIGALPPWTFGFFVFAQPSPVVSALFWLRASCVCFSTSTQRHAWLELCKGWFNGGPGWIDQWCLASPRDDLRSYHPESTEIPNVQPSWYLVQYFPWLWMSLMVSLA